MKTNGKIIEKIVKGGLIGIGTLLGMVAAACVKAKDDPDEVVDDEIVFGEVLPEEEVEVTEEVSE